MPRKPRKQGDSKMRRRSTWVGLFSAAITVTAIYCPKKVHATPAQGFTSTTIAQGRFGEIDVFNRFLPPSAPVSKLWLSWQKTKGSSDGYVLNNVWQPGGSTGWHTHLGQTLVIVTAGAVTQYQGDDPSCTPKGYPTGMGFVDAGGGHVHIRRNECNVA